MNTFKQKIKKIEKNVDKIFLLTKVLQYLLLHTK